VTGANFSGADVRGAEFYRDNTYYPTAGISIAQLYSTASYQNHDLTGIQLSGHNLTGVNLVGQTLTNVNLRNATLTNANLSQTNLSTVGLYYAILTGANLTGAEVRGTNFERGSDVGGITPAQLYSTASYVAHDLTGIGLDGNSLTAVNLVGQILTFIVQFRHLKTRTWSSQAHGFESVPCDVDGRI
jgi:uncharacterized protein YjbI with pentapeptide repeats